MNAIQKYPHTIKNQIVTFFVASLVIIAVSSGVYFTLYSNILRNRTNQQTAQALEEARDTIIDIAQDMRTCADQVAANRYSQAFLSTTDVAQRIANSDILNDSILKMSNFHSNVSNIAIIDMNGEILAFPLRHYKIMDLLIRDYGILSDQRTSGRFTDVIHDSYANKDYLVYLEPIYNLRSGDITNKIGTCIVITDISEFTAAIRGAGFTSSSFFFLTAGGSDVIAATGAKENMDIANRLCGSLDLSQPSGAKENQGYFIQWKDIPELGWQIISVVRAFDVTAQSIPFLASSIVLFILVMLTLIMLYGQIIRGIAQPIVEVSEFMQHYQQGDPTRRLSVDSYREVSILADRCNSMLDSLAKTNRENMQMQSNMYEMRLALKQAELLALQSQINPHFLYNTLDCIKGYGYMLKSDEIVAITSSLSSLLRYAIKGPAIVTIRDEIGCVESYLTIIRLRYEDRFTFDVTVAPEARGLRVPRFMLQPLVENAVYHGLEPKPGRGHLSVRIVVDDPGLLGIDVHDDGVGMDAGHLEQLRQAMSTAGKATVIGTTSAGIGLLNVAKRLYLHAPGSVMGIDSVENSFTDVHITMRPIEAVGEDKEDDDERIQQ